MLVNRIILLIFLGLPSVNYGKESFDHGGQEWGYVEVEQESHMFWWLYYTSENVTNYFEKPLMIWLQGGPGISSTGYGNFEEIGPLNVNLSHRTSTWVKDFNVLFIDSPVGSGFSYATSRSAFARTNEKIALHLLVCIKSFLEQFPRFAHVPTYIAGETYGGKMAAEFATFWYKDQVSGILKSNLKGVVLGDAWISPIDSVMGWAPFLLQTGMIDNRGYDKIMISANRTKFVVEIEEWALATYTALYTQSVILNVTNNINFNNILHKTYAREHVKVKFQPGEFTDEPFQIETFDNDDLVKLMNNNVKKALQLNSTWGEQSHRVFLALWEDFMKPVVDKVAYLLNESDLKVFVYTGQLDLLVESSGTLHWVEKLQWRYVSEWANASRDPFVVGNVIQGYFKAYDRFKMFWLDRSGNMDPNENSAGMKALLKDLVSDAHP